MPFQYSVRELTPRPDTPMGEITEYNSDRVFHLTSQEIAETHEDGHFCLLKNNGDQLTCWMKLHGNHADALANTLKAMKDSGTMHLDALQERLNVGDYVTLALNPAEMSVAKVLAFTPKQVKLLVYGRSYGTAYKIPSGLVKIHQTILSD